LVQSIVNSATLPRLGKHSALTAMTGLPADSPLASITLSEDVRPIAVNTGELRRNQAGTIKATLKALKKMHKDVEEKTSAARQRSIDAHNAKVNVQPCNVRRGDFVLRGVLPRHQHPKLALRWVRPYRVTHVLSGFIYVLEDLLTGKCQEVHARRIRFFRNSDFCVTQTVLDHLSYQAGELHTIEKFVGIREWHASVEVKARWSGHESWEDTWEGIKEMVQDVPVMLEAYLTWVRENGTSEEKYLVDRSQR
jgi:hypothetical protein